MVIDSPLYQKLSGNKLAGMRLDFDDPFGARALAVLLLGRPGHRLLEQPLMGSKFNLFC
jgi:hypothetical protein